MLVLISARYTKTIINSHLKAYETKVFEVLMPMPSLLLDYLENLLENRGKKQQGSINAEVEVISSGTLALYITLLC